MAKADDGFSDYFSTRMCSPEGSLSFARRKWRTLRAFMIAFVRFKHSHASVVHDIDHLLREVENSPCPRRERKGKTLLYQAIDHHRRTEDLFQLIARGSGEDVQAIGHLIANDPRRYMRDMTDRDSIVNRKNLVGHTPLYEAALNGHVGVVRLLLDNDADLHYPSSISENEVESTLEVAARWGHIAVVEFLLQVGKFSKQELAAAIKVCHSPTLKKRLKTFKPSSGAGVCCSSRARPIMQNIDKTVRTL